MASSLQFTFIFISFCLFFYFLFGGDGVSAILIFRAAFNFRGIPLLFRLSNIKLKLWENKFGNDEKSLLL